MNTARENRTFKMFNSSDHLVIAPPSLQSEHSRRSLAAVREELEVARQEAAQALDCLCAERESRAQDALQLKDAVPLSKHKEALSAVSEQLAQTLQELQEEKSLRGQAEEQAAGLEARLQAMKDSISKEEHENIKVSSRLLIGLENATIWLLRCTMPQSNRHVLLVLDVWI